MRSRWDALSRAVAILAAVLVSMAAAPQVAGAATDEAADGAPVRVVAATDDDLTARAAAIVAAMSVEQKAAAIVMVHTPGTDPGALGAFLRDTGAGGFIVMGANVPAGADAAAVRTVTSALTADPALPPLIAVDQEGGDVRRLRTDDFPSSLTLKNEAADAVAAAFRSRGALVRDAGIDVNFGIVADVTGDAGSFIHRRALGTGADEAAPRVAAAVTGEAPFVASTIKHFPGHGAAPGDSHRVIPSTAMSLEQWRVSEAPPFVAGIEAGADLVMFGHLAYTAVDAAPASLSARWHDILREELGFEGVAITDDMAMLEASGDPAYADPVANAVAAVAAGNDMVLGVSYTTVARARAVIDGIAQAASAGTLSPDRLREAATRVIELRLARATGEGAVRCDSCAPVD
jgi:beta-N-acetylhexosaminidase